MPALSDPTTWRKSHSARGYLFVLKPTVVFQAQINMATVTYPLTSLTFDNVTTGAYTDIQPGMTLIIGSSAGASDLGRQRVRAAATSSVIPIGRTPKGVFWGELNVSDNVYITVLELYEVWAKIPFITDAGVSFKDQTAFSASIAEPPVANGGCAVAGFVDPDTNLLTVNFDASDSILVDADRSSLTWSWNFGQGDTSTHETVSGIEFPPGFYYVRLTVNDGTNTHTTRIPVYAAARTGANAPVSVETDTVTLKPEGATMSFTLKAASLDLGDYPYGTLVIYFEDEFYAMERDSLSGPSGREKVKYVGWIDNEPTSIRFSGVGSEKRVTLNAVGVAQRLAKLPGFGQIVKNKNSPTTWQEMKDANIDRYLHHLLHWHSTALEVAPFQWSGQGHEYPFTELSSGGQSLYDQVDQRARAIAYRLTCTRRGELLLRGDPQRLPDASATDVEIVSLTDNDWSEVNYEATPAPKSHWLNGNAIVADLSMVKSVFCIAPGATPGQGLSEADAGSQLVRTQVELNQRTGKDYARENAIQSVFRLTLTHGGDAGLDPAYMEWVRWGISAQVAAQRGLTIVNTTRFLLLETQITSDHRNNSRKQVIQIERKVIGLDAQTITPETISTTTPDYPAIPTDDTYDNWPEDSDVIMPEDYPIDTTSTTTAPQPDASGNMCLLTTGEWVGLCTNFRKSTTLKCNNITPELAGGESVKQAVWSKLGVDAYVLVNDSTNSRVFYTENALDSTVVWVASESIEGIYTQIEPMSTQGQVKIKGFIPGDEVPVSDSIDLTTPEGAAMVSIYGPDSFGDFGWEEGVGFFAHTPGGGDENASQISVRYTFPFPANIDDSCGWDLDEGPDDPFSVTGYTMHDGVETSGIFGGNHRNYTNPVTSLRIVILTRPFGVERTATISELHLSATVLTSVTVVAYSSNYGADFNAPKQLTPSLGSNVGFDVDKIGNTSLVAVAGQVKIATDPDGDYEDYGDPLPDGIAGNCIFLPRFTFAGANNAGISTPQYVLLSGAISEDDTSAFRVTSAGEVFTSITPTQAGVPGGIAGPNAFASPWKAASKMAGIFDFDGTKRLKTSTSSGSAWTDRGELTSDAIYIRMREGDERFKELYIADGSPKFSNDFGATIVTKIMPVEGPLVSIEVYG